MKLNIEELALEAGFKSRNGFIRVQHTNGSFVIVDDELEAFARLIVERCAATVEAESVELVGDGDEAYNMALRHSAAAIRNLLGDE